MRRLWIVLAVLALGVPFGTAWGQALNARRMAMGGVVLAGGGSGGEAANVAYRAVPAGHGGASIPLPLGLIPFFSNPPELDPDKPDFNIYKLANTLYNPPWNIQLIEPKAPESDITIAIAKNSLAVDLGDIRNVFPKDHSRIGNVTRASLVSVGVKQLFVSVAPLVHYENDLSLNHPLHDALANGAAFTPNTDYALYDNARGQAAMGLDLGWASALAKHGDPRTLGSAFYAGARVKLLRGLAYGSADNVASFSTGDTLFSASPVDVQYQGHLRDAGPDGGGFGEGLDLGGVWLKNGLEIGVGVNNIATRIHWKVRESYAHNDSASGDYVQDVVAEHAAFTSEVPTTVTANAAVQLGTLMLAGDVVRGVHTTVGHIGIETWLNRFALRCGTSIDANQQLQYAAGSGIKFGRIGLDLALATNSSNLSRERGLELGAGLSLYH